MTSLLVEFPCRVSAGYSNQLNDYYSLWCIMVGTVAENYVHLTMYIPEAMCERVQNQKIS